jgi:uncharacterized protein YcfJ
VEEIPMHTIKVLALALSLALAGCAEMNKQQSGTAIGAVLGGVAGRQIAGSNNRVVGVATGAAIGAFVGNRIGKHLSEQDKRRAADASARTAETGRSQQFRTSTGATVSTASAGSAAPASPQSSTAEAQTASTTGECRTVRQTITLQNGTSETEDVRLCNGPDGWQPA